MSGYTRTPGQAVPLTLASSTSLNQSGLVLTLNGSNKGILAGATSTPYGIALDNTMDAAKFGLTGEKSYKSGAIVAVVRNGQIKLPVVDNNSAISKGDPVQVSGTATGKVDKSVIPTEVSLTTSALIAAEIKRQDRVVGIAEENVDAGTASEPGQEYVLVSISIQKGVGP